MIIIIKKILMCLVFATQLLIMAWATGGRRSAAKMDSAHRPPPTCPEVSGLGRSQLPTSPPSAWTGRGMAHNVKLEEMNCVMWLVKQRNWTDVNVSIFLLHNFSTHVNYSYVTAMGENVCFPCRDLCLVIAMKSPYHVGSFQQQSTTVTFHMFSLN